MDEMPEPKLAPAGAGLPLPELLIGKMIFTIRRLTGNRTSFNQRFVSERASIRRLVESCDADSLGKRVLIKRPPGLEDSSRYWSVLMTLDHLRIVNSQLVQVFERLPHGKLPDREASTAAVKPSAGVTQEVIREYEASCDSLLSSVAAVPDLKTKLRYRHPWFGPMDAHAWHSLAGGHMGIHRIQIERIIEGLRMISTG